MNTLLIASSPKFGAVYTSRPQNEEALFFQHDPDQEGLANGYYATGEDKTALRPLTDAINDAAIVYSKIKRDFLIDNNHCDDQMADLFVAAATGNIHKAENNEKRRETDERLQEKYEKNIHHRVFTAACRIYEKATADYLAFTKELAQKAQ